MDWNESLWSYPVHDRCDELKRCQTREQQLVWLALGFGLRSALAAAVMEVGMKTLGRGIFL